MLQFDSLKSIPGLRHAITTRGGNAAGPYDALNLGYHVGDDAARVTQNRKKVAAELGYDAARLVAAQQVHGANSQIVTEADAGRGAFDWDSALPDCDALIVQEPRIPVLIQVADCAPILIVDPKNHVLAIVHAGWRGAVARIASQTLTKMQITFGTRAENVFVGIGPCLGPFEIGEEVAETAAHLGQGVVIRYPNEPRDYLDPDDTPVYPAIKVEAPKPQLALRRGIENDLQDAGVPHSQIEPMKQCTRQNNALFFSHRAQNGVAGRFGLIAWWEN